MRNSWEGFVRNGDYSDNDAYHCTKEKKRKVNFTEEVDIFHIKWDD